jgi:NAD(P)-dependent dehydrogenase (short-subunit alcohol dehydrogenase family)
VSHNAIVTGAGGAIGSALVDALRARGFTVVGLDLVANDDRGTITCDVTDTGSVAGAVPEAIAQLGGRLDVLVNNAGIGGPASAGKPPGEHVRKMLDVNLLGAWEVTAAAIDALVESRGRVVLVGSRMAFLGLPLGAAYGVSKRALLAYADALRAEYATHVAVTCVHPAFVRTPIHKTTQDAGLKLEGFSKEEPLEDVVATLVEACTSDKPKRNMAVTRGGALQRAVAHHAPGLVDKVVARTLDKRIAAGDLDDAAMAAPLRERHGRTEGAT